MLQFLSELRWYSEIFSLGASKTCSTRGFGSILTGQSRVTLLAVITAMTYIPDTKTNGNLSHRRSLFCT